MGLAPLLYNAIPLIFVNVLLFPVIGLFPVIFIIISINYNLKDSEPEKTTGPSGVIPIAVLKEESNVQIVVSGI